MIPPPPGQQATAERHAALTPLHLVFPLAQDYGRRPNLRRTA